MSNQTKIIFRCLKVEAEEDDKENEVVPATVRAEDAEQFGGKVTKGTKWVDNTMDDGILNGLIDDVGSIDDYICMQELGWFFQ
ncbi:hypothetical protein L2E82_48742 [Cichorium intybus]|uniref:Uncharacterized protein n=1 Tax=Cichorium intybus TaxID=13427 RepID=A0ACB8YZ90_CICIN|nr:hypothetical protein L2E82_48742 [Cichorium intybus]